MIRTSAMRSSASRPREIGSFSTTTTIASISVRAVGVRVAFEWVVLAHARRRAHSLHTRRHEDAALRRNSPTRDRATRFARHMVPWQSAPPTPKTVAKVSLLSRHKNGTHRKALIMKCLPLLSMFCARKQVAKMSPSPLLFSDGAPQRTFLHNDTTMAGSGFHGSRAHV